MFIEAGAAMSIAKQLSTLFAKPGADAIVAKLNGLSSEKDTRELRAQYEEIIYELLQDRNAALAIAKEYKDELENIQISEEEINSLHNTVSNVIDVLITSGGISEEEQASMHALKDLISADTLRSLQLLGFNYKEAIGSTLTELVKLWINTKWSPKPAANQSNNKKK